MSFREVRDNGKLATVPFIGPAHVARIDIAPKLRPGADPALLVTLTSQGEERMLRFTSSNKGRAMATFCGDVEIYRATILAPFGNHFRVAMSLPNDTRQSTQ